MHLLRSISIVFLWPTCFWCGSWHITAKLPVCAFQEIVIELEQRSLGLKIDISALGRFPAFDALPQSCPDKTRH